MTSIFTLENIDDFSERLNIDDLYQRKQQRDLQQLELFNKLLHRVHVKIRTVSRQKIDEQLCWFLVPETILGAPKYDQGAAIAFLMDKLKSSGFDVKYFHPNLIGITWAHWIPSYVRSEFKKKTGIALNERGEQIDETADAAREDALGDRPVGEKGGGKPRKMYTPIRAYKPSGRLLYDPDMLNRIETKFA